MELARFALRAGFAGALALALAPSAPGAEEVRLRAAFVADGIAAGPGDPRWSRVPEAKLSLTPQIIVPPHGGGGVAAVSLRAMHDGEWIAIRLEWPDATADREVGVDTFRDAAALGFPLAESEPPPSPFMGDPQHPVAIWQWTADLEAQARGQGGFAKRYPSTEGVWYFPQDASVTREVGAWRGGDPVLEFVASGFGTLDRRPLQNVLAQSSHAKQRWSVVLRRPLATGDPNDPAFRPGDVTRLIVAVWEGGQGEVNGRKSVTLSWTPLVLETTLAGDGAR